MLALCAFWGSPCPQNHYRTFQFAFDFAAVVDEQTDDMQIEIIYKLL